MQEIINRINELEEHLQYLCEVGEHEQVQIVSEKINCLYELLNEY